LASDALADGLDISQIPTRFVAEVKPVSEQSRIRDKRASAAGAQLGGMGITPVDKRGLPLCCGGSIGKQLVCSILKIWDCVI
jgi:hypothetical protein